MIRSRTDHAASPHASRTSPTDPSDRPRSGYPPLPRSHNGRSSFGRGSSARSTVGLLRARRRQVCLDDRLIWLLSLVIAWEQKGAQCGVAVSAPPAFAQEPRVNRLGPAAATSTLVSGTARSDRTYEVEADRRSARAWTSSTAMAMAASSSRSCHAIDPLVGWRRGGRILGTVPAATMRIERSGPVIRANPLSEEEQGQVARARAGRPGQGR